MRNISRNTSREMNNYQAGKVDEDLDRFFEKLEEELDENF
tara:strand:- start:384 stop:503 length:120 start_codon:yes stop_codon:yes gene_type:complete